MVTIEIEMVQGGFESREDLVAGLRELADRIDDGCHTIYLNSDAVAHVREEDNAGEKSLKAVFKQVTEALQFACDLRSEACREIGENCEECSIGQALEKASVFLA